jgi:DNA-binding beta-propeller fold protein YncE
MRKAILALTVLMLVVASVVIVFLVRRRHARRPPTLIGWHAQVSTLAGDGSPLYRDAAAPAQAAFADPFGMAISDDGMIYVADAGDSNRIRKLAPEGSVTTLAGSSEGDADGAGAQAAFNTPSGLALDATGNVFVADTGNNRIRKITPQGLVSTVAGDGTAGYRDGPAAEARFDGPIGIAVDAHGNIFVADSYNDRIREITSAGIVSTVAGAGLGYADGPANCALFDTPCGVVVTADGALIVADSGNNRLRKIAIDGQVTTLPVVFPADAGQANLSQPLGLALTHDGFLYVTDRERIMQIAPDGAARVIAGGLPGYADGSDNARFNQLAGVAIDMHGDLYVADGGNYLVRRLSERGHPVRPDATSERGHPVRPDATTDPLPRLTNETLGEQSLLWPLDPQHSPHEVAATVGEVRGSFDTKDSRDHLHSGLDVFGAYGDTVRAVRSEKVHSPVANWGFDDLGEGLRVGVVSYIHIHVGRDKDEKVFNDPRFVAVKGADGKLIRMRVRRGTRFRPGDALGTINRMYHVHLNVGPPGNEINPLSLSPVGFKDTIEPTIEPDGIQLFNEAGTRLSEKQAGRLVMQGRVRIVVDAFDRTNLNSNRRRLGLYRLGYQILKSDGTPAPGFEQPRINLVFNRLPPDRDATKLAYAENSGITVYGSAVTRFLYNITNTVRDGRAAPGVWDANQLAKGDYILRIIAADYSGNEAHEGRDVLITVK